MSEEKTPRSVDEKCDLARLKAMREVFGERPPQLRLDGAEQRRLKELRRLHRKQKPLSHRTLLSFLNAAQSLVDRVYPSRRYEGYLPGKDRHLRAAKVDKANQRGDWFRRILGRLRSRLER